MAAMLALATSRHPAISPPEEILEEARNGRMVILVDDEDRENEGDLVIPAQFATPDAVNFMARWARGLICLALTGERVSHLGLPLMSSANGTRHQTAFTVSVEAREGVTTGISAADRARTIQVAIDPARGPEDLVTPGHVFPLVAQPGGVLTRAGHTEAAVDIARLAGLTPAGVICEIMNDDGAMARLPDCIAFAQRHALKVGTIADLIAYRRRHDSPLRRGAEERFTSAHGGDWLARAYRDESDGSEHLALIKGDLDPTQPTLVRMHTLSLMDDLLGRQGGRGDQLHAAMREISAHGSGVIVAVRGTQPSGLEAALGGGATGADADGVLRAYGSGAQVLADLGVTDMILLTNSRRHSLVGLEGYGLQVIDERPIPST